MNDELVTIATFDNTIQANLARNQLAAAGIRATLVDEHTVGLNWMLSNAIGGVKLIVKQEDYDDAARILDAALPEENMLEEEAATDPEALEDDEGLPSDDEPIVAEKPASAPTQREQDAERALRAAWIGILLMPLQLYAAWLLLGVWLSRERLRPEYRRQAWKGLAICLPFLFAWLLAMKYWFWSGTYYEIAP